MTVIQDAETSVQAEVNNPIYTAARNRPVGLWPLNADFLDYSGYGKTATAVGATYQLPLVTGLSKSTKIDNSSIASFETDIFAVGTEDEPFTLEVSFRTIQKTEGLPDSDGLQQVLGHTGEFDGILVEGTVISFVTKYDNATEARCTYDTQFEKNVRVAAVHTNEKNSLYVNGVLVDEVDIPEDARGAQYVSSDGYLYSGETSSTRALTLNLLAIYPTALSSDIVGENYGLVGSSPQVASLVNAFGGHPVGITAWPSFIEYVWNSQSSWTADSLITDAAVMSGVLYPRIENDVTVAGSWTNAVALDAASTTSIYAVVADWDGEGVEVEASLDGESWVAVERLRKISIIPDGFMPTETILHIRVTFVAGLSPDLAALRSLTVRGYENNQETIGNVNIILNGVAPMKDLDSLYFSDDWGVYINNGYLGISPVVAAGEAIRTIEVWSRSYSPFTLSVATSQEFVSETSDQTGEWVVTHFVLTADLAGQANIIGIGQIGRVVVYNTALSAADVDEIVDSYFRIPSTSVTDSSSVTATDSLLGAEIYAYDWTIIGAG